jgi:anti-sigma factor RsiW
MSFLSHRRIPKDVEAFVDGELAGDAGEEVARHLSVCWECGVLVETLRLIKHALRQRTGTTPSPLAARRLRRFAEDIATASGRHGRE